jgi:hypothetical protein
MEKLTEVPIPYFSNPQVPFVMQMKARPHGEQKIKNFKPQVPISYLSKKKKIVLIFVSHHNTFLNKKTKNSFQNTLKKSP